MAHFEAVARLGGISRASEGLQISASADSQQIRHLDQQMGVKLFHREKRHLRLTIDGERLFQTTTQAFQSLREVRAAIVRQRESHILSIRVSPSFGARWLAPRLIEFTCDHPNWNLRADATPSFSAFETEVVDQDLRYGEGGWEGLHSACVVSDMILPMFSPAYLAELGKISADPREQLAQARLIDSVKGYFRWDYWLPRNGIAGALMTYPYRFDRSSMSVQLAKDSGGVILESTTLAFEELRSGQLVPLSDVFDVIEFPAYWLVCPARHMGRRSVRLFANWIESTAQRDMATARSWLETRGHKVRLEPRAGFVDPESGQDD